MSIWNKTDLFIKSTVTVLLDPSRFFGALFVGLLVLAIGAMISVYWSNDVPFATFSAEDNVVMRESLHSSFAGRGLFFTVQAISWGVLIWLQMKLYRICEDFIDELGIFSIFGLVATIPASYWFLQISGWLMFNDKSIFMREWFVKAASANL